MLTKKILKAVLNVKHTAIDDMKILPDGSFAIMVHPTKGDNDHGVPAIGIQTRFISLQMSLV